MCGNGVRCFAKFLVNRGYVQASDGSFVADTLAGPKPISFTVNNEDKMIQATVDMGHPILEPSEVPVNAKANATSPAGAAYAREIEIDSPWGPFAFTCVSMGNPHAITFINDFNTLPKDLFTSEERSLATLDLEKIGAFYESNPSYSPRRPISSLPTSERRESRCACTSAAAAKPLRAARVRARPASLLR